LSNFIGEFLVLQGAALAKYQWAVFAAIGVILSACYMLWLYQRVFLGRAPGMTVESAHGHGHGHDPDTAAQADAHASHDHSGFHMPDMSFREWAAILPMIVLMIWMGVAPQTFLPSIGASNAAMLSTTKGSLEQQVKSTTDLTVQETAHAK
jgi:NADH-quinone oxidoreductase subunit M